MNSAETTFKLSHAARPATIRAELIGSDECTALGITVHSFAPVLASCRQLIDAGHDPDRALHAYRGDTLCLTVKSISTGARLEINAKGTGFIGRRSVRTAPPVARLAWGRS